MAGTRVRETYLSPDDVAEILGVNRSTIFRLLKARQMTRIKVGSATKIPLSSVHDYLAANTIPASTAECTESVETARKPVVRGGEGARAKYHRAR